MSKNPRQLVRLWTTAIFAWLGLGLLALMLYFDQTHSFASQTLGPVFLINSLFSVAILLYTFTPHEVREKKGISYYG